MRLQSRSKVSSALTLSLFFLRISFAALIDKQELAFIFALVIVEVAPLVLLLVLL